MTSGLRVLVIGTDAVFSRAVRDVLAAQIPDAASDSLDPARVRTRPEAGALVIDARADEAGGMELARRLRAMGYAFGIVLLSDSREGAVSGAGAGDTPNPVGIAVISADRLSDQLVPQLAEQTAAAGAPYADQLMQYESVTPEQAEALRRVVDLCRRVIDLSRSLDGIGERKPRSS